MNHRDRAIPKHKMEGFCHAKAVFFIGRLITMTPETLLQEAEALRDQLVSSRRTLHQNAETGFALDRTLSFV